MNLLLLFFALPIATIILAVVLEKILRCPFLVSATFFAIYLIIAFSLFDAMFLVFVIAYTILAFLSALIAECFYRRCNNERKCSLKCCLCTQNNNNNNTITLSNQDIARIAYQLANMQNDSCSQGRMGNNNGSCNCNCSNDIATVNVTNNTTGGRTNWCCYRK